MNRFSAAYLRRKFPALQDIDDVIQESFLKVLRARIDGSLRSARGFLFTAARQRGPRCLSPSPTRISRDHRSKMLRCASWKMDPVAEMVIRDQELDLLAEAIESLPSRCRHVLKLRKIYGLSHREIAEQLGISERTVNVQVGLGVRRCADFFVHGEYQRRFRIRRDPYRERHRRHNRAHRSRLVRPTRRRLDGSGDRKTGRVDEKTDPRHAAAFTALEIASRSLDRLASFRPDTFSRPDPDLPLVPRRLAARSDIRRNRHWLPSRGAAAAAALIFAFVIRTSSNDPSNPAHEQVSTTIGGFHKRSLSDGSVLELNTDSRVEITYSRAYRRIKLLQGEVYVSVAKDASRPFIVTAGKVATSAPWNRFQCQASTGNRGCAGHRRPDSAR